MRRIAPSLVVPVVTALSLASASSHADKKAPAAPPAAPPSAAVTTTSTAPVSSVAFVWPQDGSTVLSDFDVVFAVNGMKLRAAGEDATDKTSGHHHLIVDGAAIPAGAVVPKDATHLHYGKGETSAHVTLAPGPHTLTMQLADGAHLSYGPALSATIKVNVVPRDASAAVSFGNVKDGDVVHSPVKLDFVVAGLKVRPAGEDALDKTSGHHHLIVDGAAVPTGVVVPKDETHLHFGKGDTSTELALKPGEHTLTLQFADGAHLSYGPTLSTTIKVRVDNTPAGKAKGRDKDHGKSDDKKTGDKTNKHDDHKGDVEKK